MIVGLVIAACAVLAYSWFEAGWVERRVLDVGPGATAGPRGSCGSRTSRTSTSACVGRTAATGARWWGASREPELVCVTGDLVSHPRVAGAQRGSSAVRQALRRPGNHDLASPRPISRRPSSTPARSRALLRMSPAPATGARAATSAASGSISRAMRCGAIRGYAEPARLADPAPTSGSFSVTTPRVDKRRPGRYPRDPRRPHARRPDRAPVRRGRLTLAHPAPATSKACSDPARHRHARVARVSGRRSSRSAFRAARGD